MTNNLIVRFPAIAEMIFNQLENCSIANCRKVNESWRSFIDDQKLPWIRKILKFSGSLTGFHDQWIQIIARTPINVVKELAVNVDFFSKLILKEMSIGGLHISLLLIKDALIFTNT